MASLVLGVVGGVVGFYVGGPVGAQIGFAIGSAAGSYVDAQMNTQHTEGPRLGDRSIQTSTYGAMLPITHGVMGLGGNVIWATDLEERSHTEDVDGGGKGGFTPGVEQTVYEYFAHFAVSLGEGELDRIQRIWADGKLWYDANAQAKGYMNWRLYKGTETQMPDPTMEAYLGVGNVPAYRGQAYVVFPELAVKDFGNRIPSLFFEVCDSATVTSSTPVLVDGISSTGYEPRYCIYGSDGSLWWYRQGDAPIANPVYRINPYTGAVLGTWYPSVPGGQPMRTITLVIPISGGRFWGVSNAYGVAGHPSGLASVAVVNPSADAVGLAQGVNQPQYVPGYDWTGPPSQCIGLGDDLLCMFNQDEVTPNMAYAARMSADRLAMVARSELVGEALAQWGPGGSTNVFQPNQVGATDGTFYYACAVINTGGNHYRIYRFNANDMRLISSHDSPDFDGSICYSMLFYRGYLYICATGYIDKWNTTTMTRVARYDVGVAGGGHIDASQSGKWLMVTGDNRIMLSGSSQDVVALIDPLDFGPGGTEILSLPAQRNWGFGPFNRDPISLDRVMGANYANPGHFQLFAVQTGLDGDHALITDVLEDYMTRVGLTPADYDVAALVGLTVRGTLLARQTPAREAMTPIARAFFFDGIESEARVKFVLRGTSAPIDIPADDLAQQSDNAMPFLGMTRGQDVDLPRTVNVNYFDQLMDYQGNSQYERRLAGSSSADLTLEVPMSLDADEAKAIASSWLYNAWAERVKFSWCTTRKYLALEPTDLVNVRGYTIRINKRTEDGPFLKWEGNGDASQIYLQYAPGGSAQGSGQTTSPAQPSVVLYLDIPLLRDADDHPGFYIGANGAPKEGWPGAGVFKSVDGGANYFAFLGISTPSIFGSTSDVLGPWDPRNHIFDEQNWVTVVVNGPLVNLPELAVLNGGNYAMVGFECIQFKYAELVATNTYRLTGLLRGQLGTQWAIGTHLIGDRFVLLTNNLRDTTHDTGELNIVRDYKAATFGFSLDLGTSTRFADTGVRLKPYAPVQVGGGRQANNDWAFQWHRCTRLSDGWMDLVDVPLGEAAESYEIDIMSGTTVKRTLTSTTQTVAYTSAQQVTDFGTNQSTVSIRVYQMSATVGRGYAGTATLTG